MTDFICMDYKKREAKQAKMTKLNILANSIIQPNIFLKPFYP